MATNTEVQKELQTMVTMYLSLFSMHAPKALSTVKLLAEFTFYLCLLEKHTLEKPM
jgi:hypothetical protein